MPMIGFVTFFSCLKNIRRKEKLKASATAATTTERLVKLSPMSVKASIKKMWPH